MEAFSLLKYWRGGGGGGDIAVGGGANSKPVTNGVATIVTAVAQNTTAETEDDDNDGDDDDGPFFDLEFSVNEEDEEEEEDDDNIEAGEQTQKCPEEEEEDENGEEDDDDEEEEREFKFTISSGSSNDRTDSSTDPNLSLSPSDDLFFKGKLVPIETSSIVFGSATPSDQPNSGKPQFPVSFLKSATKFRVFMLGLKKSKPNNISGEKSEPTTSSKEEAKKQKQQQGKFFTVKFKVEEVPIVSLFTRDNSSRVSSSSSSTSSSSSNKPQKQSSDNDSSSSSASSSSSSEEKRFAKEVMQRYLKMVKPLYVRVSRRYGEKLRFSGHLSLNGSLTKSPSPPKPAAVAASPAPVPEEKSSEPEVSEAPASNAKSLKQVNLPAGLRVVCKHLGKSRSASAAAVPVAPPGTASSRRRDDSLLQQQDGIQSAILHCKRSFNAIRDSEASLLSRSASDPSRKSSEVAKV